MARRVGKNMSCGKQAIEKSNVIDSICIPMRLDGMCKACRRNVVELINIHVNRAGHTEPRHLSSEIKS